MVCLAGLGCGLGPDHDLMRPAPPPAVTGNGDPNTGVRPVSFIPGPTEQTTLKPGSVAPLPQGAVASDPLAAMQSPQAPQPGLDCSNGFPPAGYNPLPTELAKKTHPSYIIEAPDILLIDAGRLIPRPPYVVQPLDILIVQATETFPNQPINGNFRVGPDGTVALGYGYGAVQVAGLTLEKAQATVRAQLEKTLKNPQVSLGLAALQAVQQVRGEHLVRADGTISLGAYGSVYVAGMALCQAQMVIQSYLAQFFTEPHVSLDVFAYNSKVFYVVVDGGGYGMQVVRFPITGNETVLDAIEHIGGIPAVGSRKHIWVARPTPANHECVQVLPVDWLAIVQSGSTRTNYQLFPGDRVYIKADPLICLDNWTAKILAPLERLLGVTLLGTSVYTQIRDTGHGTAFVTGF
jgi:polysaccharide export outer membrane protein